MMGSIPRTTFLAVAAIAASCAHFRPAPIESVPFAERSVSDSEGGLTVTVAVPTMEEAREVFDSKLHKKRIQPVWIEVRNESPEPAWFFAYGVDPDYFPPLEAAWKCHRTWAPKTNRRIDAYFRGLGIPSRIPPGEDVAGFVFVNLDRGLKYVPVTILRENDVVEFEFVVDVPGFKADYERVNLEQIYEGVDFPDLTEERELRDWVAALPCCTTNARGTRSGDPVNFALVASREALRLGFTRAGWDVTRAMSTGSAVKTGASAVFGQSYRYAPISPLYALDRPQDLGLQKARWNIHQRNHLRLWLAPLTYRGDYVLVGQISRDIGSRLTTKSPTLTTHKIDPDVDEARDFLVLDLWSSHVLRAFGFTTGVGAAPPEEPRANLTGDPYFTDGRRVVLFLSDTRVAVEDVEILDWEIPEPSGETPAR